ncbi:MAG: YbaB/EbfC family nucleoid-associated protein [Alphaproteobacteria bacterium]|nr:YbaB/EbfC family nucleoid-associated protein [Alphaproteobacteria bacterium]
MVNINELVAQARQMQEKVKIAQQELAKLSVEGQAGGGAVKVILSGVKQAKRIAISDKAMKDKALLEDLIVAAFNDAKDKADAIATATMEQATNGLKLPEGV